MAEERSLPGWPKKKLVKDVRRHLSHYGIRPTCPSLWRATWQWAEKIAYSYFQIHWPIPSEIATQYIVLLLADMQQSHMLRLPFQASEKMPPEVAALLPLWREQGFPPIEIGKPRTRRKRTPSCPSKVASLQPNLFQNL